MFVGMQRQTLRMVRMLHVLSIKMSGRVTLTLRMIVQIGRLMMASVHTSLARVVIVMTRFEMHWRLLCAAMAAITLVTIATVCT